MSFVPDFIICHLTLIPFLLTIEIDIQPQPNIDYDSTA